MNNFHFKKPPEDYGCSYYLSIIMIKWIQKLTDKEQVCLCQNSHIDRRIHERSSSFWFFGWFDDSEPQLWRSNSLHAAQQPQRRGHVISTKAAILQLLISRSVALQVARTHLEPAPTYNCPGSLLHWNGAAPRPFQPWKCRALEIQILWEATNQRPAMAEISSQSLPSESPLWEADYAVEAVEAMISSQHPAHDDLCQRVPMLGHVQRGMCGTGKRPILQSYLEACTGFGYTAVVTQWSRTDFGCLTRMPP